jgi:processed acidic surface protein
MKRIAATFILSAALIVPGVTANAAPKQSELDAYLASIQLTQVQLEEYLESYGDSLDEYDTVADLKDVLGERLTEETLAALLEEYELTEQDVIDLAVEYDDMDPGASLLDTYYFTSDIEYLIDIEYSSYSFSDMINEYDEGSIDFGGSEVTSAEMNKFVSYVRAVFDKEPEAAAKMDVLFENLMMNYAAIDTTELTASQTADLLNTMKEIEKTIHIDIKVFNEQGDVMKPLDFLALPALEENYVLKVLDDKGNILLDMILSDTLQSGDDPLLDADPIMNIKHDIGIIKHTENGGKLPKTASHTAEWALFGLLLAVSGVALRKKLN